MKPTKRKQSRIVAEKLLAAHEIASDPSRLNEGLDRIGVIRKFGVSLRDLERGYTDDDKRVADVSMKDAIDLARREQEHPNDFISEKVATAIRSQTTREQEKRRQPDELEMIAEQIEKISATKGVAVVEKASGNKINVWLSLEGINTSLSTTKRAKKHWLKKRLSEPAS